MEDGQLWLILLLAVMVLVEVVYLTSVVARVRKLEQWREVVDRYDIVYKPQGDDSVRNHLH